MNENEGWVCPKCGSVMAPWMTHCVRCVDLNNPPDHLYMKRDGRMQGGVVPMVSETPLQARDFCDPKKLDLIMERRHPKVKIISQDGIDWVNWEVSK